LLQKEHQRLLSYQTTRSPEVRALDEQIRASLRTLRAELVGARERLLPEQARMDGKLRALPANDARRARLEREVQANERMYLVLKEEDQRARLREASLIQEVTVVERPVTATLLPQTGRSVKGLVAVLIGLFLGAVIAMILEGLDTSIGAIEEVETLLDIPVVGIVPPIDFEKTGEVLARANAALSTDSRGCKAISALVTHCDPKSPTAEAYRTIRTAIDKNGTDAGQVIMVTSSVGGEGKTTTAANLAVTFAQMGRRTLLVGADLRKPDIHKLFGLDNESGLANVLVEGLPLEKATHGVSELILGDLGMEVVFLTPGLDNLYVMSCGKASLNPAEILSSEATAGIFQELRETYDVVIVDTPPVISVTDAAILCAVADGVVMVYELGKVPRDVLKRANAHLQLADARMLGVVLNDVKADAASTLADSYHNYNYYYYYGEESTDLEDGPWRRFAGAAARLFRRPGRV
ncbi:MAG: AAA family ATPase, partial [Planctomycetota bacterium]